MAAPVQGSVIHSQSKSAKKKKAKTPSSENTAPAPVTETTPSTGVPESNNGESSYESPYIKELYKSIRNVNKKIANASKVDNILAENPDKSLDDLITARKINADQKAQILKKPQLQASLAQLEEQIAQYKKFDQEYKATLAAEMAALKKSSEERFAKELEESIAAAKAEAVAEAKQEQRAALLLISQFLHLAAVRRGDEQTDPSLDLNMALEGVLAKVYTGDAGAVENMVKIIEGSSEATVSVNSETLTSTFADVKAAVLSQPLPAPVDDTAEVAEETGIAVETTDYPVQSDPTIVNAGLTELDASTVVALTSNGHGEPYGNGIPSNSGFGDGAANAAAEANWDANNDLSTSQEWVEVPRDSTETDIGVTATPAAASNVQSWADDQPDTPAASSTPLANPNDGFHEVQRNRGGNRGDGQGRSRGGRGGGRGSFRGDGRGRGRGGQRGGQRGGRRTDES